MKEAKDVKGGLGKYQSLMEQGIPKRLALSMACNSPGDHDMSGFSAGGGDKQKASIEPPTLKTRIKANKTRRGGIVTTRGK